MINELEQVKAVSNAAFKSVLVICVCVLFGITLENCKVDTEKIEVCNDACQRGMGHMESVTAYKCKCKGGSLSEKSSPWVLD